MGNMGFIDAMIEKKLLDLHCGYIGKVVSTNGETATVQPLGLIKEKGNATTKAQAVVSNVPIACRHKITTQTITFATDDDGGKQTMQVAVPVPIAKGDVVVCLCADRDISEARRGNNVLPPAGRHSISDSIIVGIL